MDLLFITTLFAAILPTLGAPLESNSTTLEERQERHTPKRTLNVDFYPYYTTQGRCRDDDIFGFTPEIHFLENTCRNLDGKFTTYTYDFKNRTDPDGPVDPFCALIV